jgi:twitching motility protein PilT
MDSLSLLDTVVKLGASDLHITNKIPPTVRLHGRLHPLEGYEPMTPESIERLVEALTTPELRQRFAEDGELDFSYGAEGIGRFRCNLFRQRGCLALVLRVINTVIPSFEDLGLKPVIRNLCQKKDGLVLVTGPTGSGKSTTLAAMIDWINRHRSEVIITLEDPVEFLHEHKRGIVNQREVGNDTKGYALGLRAALREDPDIILVGEMRDRETIEIALKAAETGHLVFSTLHTRTAGSTVDRIIDTFPPHQQSQIRTQLAGSLQAVISQTLVVRRGGRGRVAVREILVATPAVRNLVREGKTHQIDSVIETGARHGMQTMAAALDEFLNRGLIDREEIEARKSA